MANPAWIRTAFIQSVEDLLKYGPTMKVGIAALPAGSILYVNAQIDTGAHGTAVSPRLADWLKLDPVAFGQVSQANLDATTAPYFRVRLVLPRIDVETEVVGLKTLEPPHDLLIGRDVLAGYRLAVDFTSGRVELHYRDTGEDRGGG